MVSTRKSSAPATPPTQSRNPITPFSTPKTVSASLKSIFLEDWWLVKAQGNALAVEGFAKSQRSAQRTFSSAAISKRHTATSLETTDGVIVTLGGSLNISRTSQNGFLPEVYNRYLPGFPFDWKEHAAGLSGQGSTSSSSARNSSQKYNRSLEDGESNPLTFSIADVPMTVTRDCIMSCTGDSKQLKTIFDDILRTSRENVYGDTTPQMNSNTEDVEAGRNATPTTAKSVKIDGENNQSTDIWSKNSQKTKKGISSRKKQTNTKPVPTRSSTRLKNLESKERRISNLA
ncbi:protein EMBRYO DEFECTIVE 1674-like [Argentina anserina]|uniref:protein EMBRYO DEFECTIVE 1674-like n=1 Tax=Argentina anserina TaxID=57926 RepID=UPI0021768522|nr:protein EMBRYO DEFECTIVE 1674-like [Potentilla anserina]